jgi:c-di-GMP-related signal transduction protein
MATLTTEDPSNQTQAFIAKQPIVDAAKTPFGYELLFRSGNVDSYDHTDGNDASLRVMANTLNLIGCDNCVGDRKIFINITRRLLLQEDYMVMPAETTVLELLEDVVPDRKVVSACAHLKRCGYQLALDDFTYTPAHEPLLDLADFVKIDFRLSDPDTRRQLAERLMLRNVKLLAEKVETQEEFEQAAELGFVYFQGFFMFKPKLVAGHELSAQQQNYVELLRLANEPELRYGKIEEVIRREPALSVKLLRYLNSAKLGLPHRIRSIERSLILLGETVVRKWISLAVLGTINADEPNEMVPICLARARFCELMACEVTGGDRQIDMFMLGLLSGIEAILNHPLGEILIQLPIARDIKTALQGGATPLGELLALLHQLERADWVDASRCIAKIGANPDQVAERWCKAMRWVSDLQDF